MVAALGALLCVLALPFAPVISDSTTVHWNAAEDGRATTAFFVPYRAAELVATVPCPAVRSALAEPGRTVLFATAPGDEPRNGLVLVSRHDTLTALIAERGFPLAVPAGTACDVQVRSTANGTHISVGGVAQVSLAGDVVPEVFGFRTDAPVTEGINVTARTRTWFQSVPTTFKDGLLIAYAALLAVALLTLLPGARRLRLPRLPRPAAGLRAWARTGARVAIDAAVLATLALWTIVGPLTDDDGFATMTIRNGLGSGDIGNYYRWFNASEAPFTLLQHLVAPLTEITLAPPVLRLPSVLAGVLTWFVVSRGVLGATLPSLARSVPTRLLAALSFLVWWLPFGLGLRPESCVALGTAGTLALLIRMRRRPPADRLALVLATAAAVVAGLTIAVTPSGVLIAAPVLLFAPALLRVVRGPAGVARSLRWLGAAGRVLLLSAAAAIPGAVMFADQTYSGVRRATEIHGRFGPDLGWYDEWLRYQFLLGTDSMGSAAKRLPVLLTLALLVVSAVLLSRKLPGIRDLPGTAILTATTVGGFAALSFTPSKWSHHFGALAGFGAPFLVAAVVLVLRAAREQARRRSVLATCGGGAVLACAAAALAFSGPNAWWLYSDYDMPWTDEPVRPGGLPLNNLVLWLGLAGVLLAAVWLVCLLRRRRIEHRAALASVGGLVPVVAMLAAVALLIGTFSTAPARSNGTYTLAAENLRAIQTGSCGLADHIQVMPTAPDGVLQPIAGAARLNGFTAGPAVPPGVPPPPVGAGQSPFVWGSFSPGAAVTGTLDTPWFGLPTRHAGTEVAVGLAGRPSDGNTLTVQFGRRGPEPSAVTALGRRRLQDPPLAEKPFDDPIHGRPPNWRDYSYWRTLAVPIAQVPAGADVVRVQATDYSTDRQGWLTVTGPVVRDVVGLTAFLSGRGPVLIDWPMSFAFPCQADFPKVRDGLAQAPAVILGGPRNYPPSNMSYDPNVGGSFAGVALTGHLVEVPSRVQNRPDLEWGRVLLVKYSAQRDRYSTTTTHQRTPGWERARGYPFD